MIKVWIDIDTGTWGSGDDLRSVEVDEDFLDEFADMSDTERSRFAQEYGESIDWQ